MTRPTSRRLYDHTHGQINRLCIHPDCQRAWSRRNKQWKLNASRGIHSLVDDPTALETVADHIHALEAAGWSRRAIAAAAGISATAISRLGNRRQAHIRRTTRDAILAIDPRTLPIKTTRDALEPFVPKRGTVRRIQALLAIGWTHRHLADLTGVKTAVVVHQPGQWVTRTTHDKVAHAYRQLAATPGPSNITRRRAAALGYLSPIHWDDIDHDPTPEANTPNTGDDQQPLRHHDQIDPTVVDRILAGEHLPATRAEKEAVTQAWVATGRPLTQLEQQTGWNTNRYTRPTTTGDAA